jgi:hypothetical protein
MLLPGSTFSSSHIDFVVFLTLWIVSEEAIGDEVEVQI